MKYLFNEVSFDDVTLKAEDKLNDWSQICQECVDKHKIDEKHLDLGAGHGLCGVEGCSNESDHYIDFPDGELIACNKYWDKHGKYQAEVDIINKTMPDRGYTDNKYMNLFIVASKLYHDVYNNGGGNIRDCYLEDIVDYIVPFENDIKAINFLVSDTTIIKNLKKFDKLELFMDEVMVILNNKDLKYTKYVVYQNYNEGKLSNEPKEGFVEVSFGEKEDYTGWMDCRLDSWNFTMV